MEKVFVLYFLLAVLLQRSVGQLSWGHAYSQKKVLLENVTVITLTEGQMTNGRRTYPVPQLICVQYDADDDDDSAGCSYKYRPKVVECENLGLFDEYDKILWNCTADLDNDVKFGYIEVTCEGYSSPDDPYILDGSCGLEYELEWRRITLPNVHTARNDRSWGSDASSIFATVIGLIVAFATVCVCGTCIGRGNLTGECILVSGVYYGLPTKKSNKKRRSGSPK